VTIKSEQKCMYSSCQVTCYLSSLTLCRAAVGMARSLLGSPPTDKTALHLSQKQWLCCEYTWNFCHCTFLKLIQNALLCARAHHLLLPLSPMPTTSKLQLLLCLLVYELFLYILLIIFSGFVLLYKPSQDWSLMKLWKAHCPQTMVGTVFLGDDNVF
jgi:hypothetical protein